MRKVRGSDSGWARHSGTLKPVEKMRALQGPGLRLRRGKKYRTADENNHEPREEWRVLPTDARKVCNSRIVPARAMEVRETASRGRLRDGGHGANADESSTADVEGWEGGVVKCALLAR